MAENDILSAIIATPEASSNAPQTTDDQPIDNPADDEALDEIVEDTAEEAVDDVDVVDDEDALEDEEPSEDDEQPGDDSGDEYTFKVNGEEVTVSVDDLIKNYSIGSTAQQRLQEATEMRKQAQTHGYTEGMEAAKEVIHSERQGLDSMRQQLSGILDHIGPQLFQPQVQQPDPAMQQHDPIGYLTQVEAFRQDQMRLQGLKQTLGGAAQKMAEADAQRLQHTQQNERIALRQKRPDLADPEKAKAFTADVRSAQTALGFTQAEIDAFPDHRGLLVLEMAGKYLALQNGKGDTPAQRVIKKAGKTLKPGGVTVQRSQKQKQRRANMDRAKQTGSVSDVAKTLIR